MNAHVSCRFFCAQILHFVYEFMRQKRPKIPLPLPKKVTATLRLHRVGEHDALLVQTARASGALSNKEAQHFE